MQVFESENLRNRIGHVHLKDCHADDPETWDYRTQRFGEQARFAELGAGETWGLMLKPHLKDLNRLVMTDGSLSNLIVRIRRVQQPKPQS